MREQETDAGLDQDAVIPLLALAVGQYGRIAPVLESGAVPSRLEDLGFVAGTLLRVVRRAPFGDPIEVEIRGYRLCLRGEQVAGLRVRPERASCAE